MTQRLGILLLGCGWAASRHSKILRGMAGVDLYFASRDRARAETYCRRFAGRRAFWSYEAGLADPDVDVALVTTPTNSHRELTELALDAGKHVIVEKPAFLRAADVNLVRDRAAMAKRRVLVAENYFYKPIAEHLRRVVRAGDLGDVRFVTLNATKRQDASGWRADPEISGGGALFEGGVHWINFASNIGLDVEEVSANRAGQREGPDRSTLVVFRYSNGAVGTLAHSWEIAAPFGGLRLSKVQGTIGSVTFESNGLWRVTTGRRKSFALYLSFDMGMRAMLADFVESLRTGRDARFTLEMARRDLAFLEEAELSMAGIL